VVQNGSLNKTEYVSTLHDYSMLSSFNPHNDNRKILSIWWDNSVLQQCTVYSWDVFTSVPVLTVPMQVIAILHGFYTEKN
jgi:hypothetical protein